MIEIQFSETTDELLDQALITRAAQNALIYGELEDEADLSIVLAGDEVLHQLNQQFLGVDRPTDVLAFPTEEVDPDTGRRYLGDVIISIPRARQQAGEQKHSLQAEILLLVVHGVLHLLGFDHGDEDEKARMWAAQDAALARLSQVGDESGDQVP